MQQACQLRSCFGAAPVPAIDVSAWSTSEGELGLKAYSICILTCCLCSTRLQPRPDIQSAAVIWCSSTRESWVKPSNQLPSCQGHALSGAFSHGWHQGGQGHASISHATRGTLMHDLTTLIVCAPACMERVGMSIV